MHRIKFNEPYISGNETAYIEEVISSGHFSGNGSFTKKCQNFCQEKWNLKKCFFTHSGTGALEMAALLLDIGSGDEVIIPSFTFPSTALAFKRQGAKIVFMDSKGSHPCLEESELESLITTNTKAIVAVHYGGVACNMDAILTVADKYDIMVVEDAAHALGSLYNRKPLGGIGQIGCYSFHESKNIHCGEGGMLVINDDRFIERAEVIWEKGTNKAAFLSGKIPKYECVDIGSSFLASDMLASFLYAQLFQLDHVLQKRSELWYSYNEFLSEEDYLECPFIPDYAIHNSHIFYILAQDLNDRNRLIRGLKSKGVTVAFHYPSLHKSPFFLKENNALNLPNCDMYSNRLIRLPLHHKLSVSDTEFIADTIKKLYEH